METEGNFLKYLEQQAEMPSIQKVQILSSATPCAIVLWDVLQMFGDATLRQEILFCNEPWGEVLVLKLGSKDLQDLVLLTLGLGEDFQEGAYLQYILRKIFARYQIEGKISLSICYN